MTDTERIDALVALLQTLINNIRNAPLKLNPGGAVLQAVDTAEQELHKITGR